MQALGEDIGEKVLERTNGNSNTLFMLKKCQNLGNLCIFRKTKI